MKICINCFCDSEIRSRIKSYDSKGQCSICGCRDTYIYDTDTDEYLNGILDNIINLYVPVSSLEVTPDAENCVYIKNELVENWNIFNKLSATQVHTIIKALSKDLYAETPELIDAPVVNQLTTDSDYLKANSLLKEFTWEQFVEALKHENRFHTNYVDTNILEIFCSFIRKSYKAGEKFYRGRISSEEGYGCDNMGPPPKDKITEGRANSAGIQRLYLASDKETTIHEIRAGAFDYITIGCFELKKDITVVDLKMINQISPVIEGLDVAQYYINREYLNKINEEMGKALRRSDSPLDYVPTQYIADFIQSIMHDGEHEYAGIEYRSTLYNRGYNLAIFDSSLFECVSTETIRIKDLKYDYE